LQNNESIVPPNVIEDCGLQKKGITPPNIIDNFDFHKKEGMFMQDNVMKACAKCTMPKHDFHNDAHMST
jgi:hypothetical protein